MNKLLHEIALDEEQERGINCVENFKQTQNILSKQELTKEQKISIVENALDDYTSKKMMNCDKLAYFEKNKVNLLLGALK